MVATSPPPSIYHIILLRHGQSVGNAQGYHQGQSDSPMTDLGKAQSRALAERWLSESVIFDQIISSTLSRARQTAEILSSILNFPLEFDAIWMERDIGKIAGLRPKEAAEKYPRPTFMHPFHPIGQSGESQWELYLRAGKALQDLLDRPPGRYLVVSHGGLLNMVLYAILGIVPQANFQGARFRFHNTAFATLSYNPNDHNWRLEGINDQAHWDDDK